MLHFERPNRIEARMPTTIEMPRPRVLVADPNAESTAMIARQLLWAGYDVVTAADGVEAMDAFAEKSIDAAVLEVMMGGVSGYEAVRRLRETPEHRLTPLVLISARAGKLDRDFAFTVGADDYVKKPFCTSELVARLALLVPTPAAPLPVARKPVARRRARANRLQPALAGAR
jgi:CheY-like chemotaxis protein